MIERYFLVRVSPAGGKVSMCPAARARVNRLVTEHMARDPACTCAEMGIAIRYAQACVKLRTARPDNTALGLFAALAVAGGVVVYAANLLRQPPPPSA